MNKITAEHLQRGAIVYVRQSSMWQVANNLESQRLQYALAQTARELSFQSVEIIDEDLGRSASGSTQRPGFERLINSVCAGSVGAVFSIEASRLARNGRDWHNLIELCGLVGTLIIDSEGVYDPRSSNDRLLLGLKGTMSDFELTLFRQRSMEAIRQKAKRGELRFCLPIGLCWTDEGKIELDPDRRVQGAIRQVFDKFVELGSVRQVLMWLADANLSAPRIKGNKNWGPQREVVWRRPAYATVLAIIRNPLYSGAYVYGRSESRTRIVDGKAHKTSGHKKAREQWTALIQDHHPGYLSWEEYERNQRVLAENTHMKKTIGRKAGRGGRSLLTGLLRCARCGRMLHVMYRKQYGRYECRNANRAFAAPRCIAFGSKKPDQTVAAEIVRVVQPHGVEVALAAAERAAEVQHEQRAAIELELEQARYEARLAARRYEAIDPDNRLVAGELESRWNAALERVDEVELRIRVLAQNTMEQPEIEPERFFELADDLEAVWNASSSDMQLKQRIVRLLINEIVVDIDEEAAEIVMVIHWHGGRHSQIRVQRPRPGEHSGATSVDAVEVVRRMAGTWPDKEIAATLNRLGLKTGAGNTWMESRVYSLRKRLRLVGYDASRPDSSVVTLNQAAERLGVGPWVVRRLIQQGLVKATQVVRSAPWQVQVASLDTEQARRGALAITSRRHRPASGTHDDRTLTLPGT